MTQGTGTGGDMPVANCICTGTGGDTSVANGGHKQPDWRAKRPRTAHTDQELAHHVEQFVAVKPNEPRKTLVANFTGVLRFPAFVEGHQWSHVRKIALTSHFGVPDANIRMLPETQDDLSKKGHCLEYTFVEGIAMEAIDLSVGQAEAQSAT